jgi:hypothetical protein
VSLHVSGWRGARLARVTGRGRGRPARAAGCAVTSARIRNILVFARVNASVALMAPAVLAAHTLQAGAPEVPDDARSTLVAEVNLSDAKPATRAPPTSYCRSLPSTRPMAAARRFHLFVSFTSCLRPAAVRA